MDYDELNAEAKSMVDAILRAHVAGSMHEGDAVRIMVRIGMDRDEAVGLLEAERVEASQP